MEETELRLYYQQIVEVWEEFCKLHNQLYEITCDEYMALLSGEVEPLEELIKSKDLIIQTISLLEEHRGEIIKALNEKLSKDQQINHISQLLELTRSIEKNLDIPVLSKLNSLLIDTVEKIQLQNKKNQIFLNKALLSLKEIKEGFTGKKQYTTYGSNGFTTKALSR